LIHKKPVDFSLRVYSTYGKSTVPLAEQGFSRGLPGFLGVAAFSKLGRIPLKILPNLGHPNGDPNPSNAQKWATAARAVVATPADPDNLAVSAMKISKARTSGGMTLTWWDVAKTTHLFVPNTPILHCSRWLHAQRQHLVHVGPVHGLPRLVSQPAFIFQDGEKRCRPWLLYNRHNLCLQSLLPLRRHGRRRRGWCCQP
jgi:hypothetical protein